MRNCYVHVAVMLTSYVAVMCRYVAVMHDSYVTNIMWGVMYTSYVSVMWELCAVMALAMWE